MLLTHVVKPLVAAAAVLTSCPDYGQPLFNKAFVYEGRMGNLEPVTGPTGYLICSTNRYGSLDDIDGFQFTLLDSTGSVVHTRGFSTGPIADVMGCRALSLMRSDGSFSFLFGNWSMDKYSLRVFNSTTLGSLNWNRKIEYSLSEYSIQCIGTIDQSFSETQDGGYLITGSRTYSASSWIDTIAPMVVKLDALGNVLWNRSFDAGPRFAWGLMSHVRPTGEVLLAFIADSTWHFPSSNRILTKINTYGNMLWSKRLDGPVGHVGGCVSTDDRYTLSSSDSSRICILEMDSAGNALWGKCYTNTQGIEFGHVRIRPTLDHGFILLTTIGNTIDPYDSDVLLFKVDSVGTIQWERTYGNPDYHQAPRDLVVNNDSSFTLLTWGHHHYLSRLDHLGQNECMVSANGLLTESPTTFSLVAIPLHSFESPMISQSKYAGDSTSLDPLLVDTCLYSVVIGVSEHIPSPEVELFPNPTDGAITVRIAASRLGSKFVLLDLLGKEVLSTRLATIETRLDLTGLSKGVYIHCAVTSSGRSSFGRLVKE